MTTVPDPKANENDDTDLAPDALDGVSGGHTPPAGDGSHTHEVDGGQPHMHGVN